LEHFSQELSYLLAFGGFSLGLLPQLALSFFGGDSAMVGSGLFDGLPDGEAQPDD
jgi:hypothetical protein